MKKILFSLILLLISILLLSFFFPKKQNIYKMNQNGKTAKNVLGTDLQSCCFEPKTGWFRDGFCNTNDRDFGVHVVCAEMTDEFLAYTSKCGNDLSTPAPQYGFPGLKKGDKWCLCVSRWKEAMEAGVAPPVILESTHEKALQTVTMDQLKKYELTK